MDQSTPTGTRDAGPRTPARSWLTVPELAVFLRDLLDHDEHDDALRFMLDGLNKIDEVLLTSLPLDDDSPSTAGAPSPALLEFLAEPPSLGDERWDTLLACSTAHVARRRGVAPPAWTAKPSLQQWWWPAGEKRRRALTMQRTPTDFRRVGIWFSERNFLTA